MSSSYVSDETLDSLVPVDLAYRELIKPYDPMVLRLAEECKRVVRFLNGWLDSVTLVGSLYWANTSGRQSSSAGASSPRY